MNFIESSFENPPLWELYMDEAINRHESGAGVLIWTPEGIEIWCALSFDFVTTNNDAEYKALLSGLRLLIRVRKATIKSDSQLVG